MRRSATLRSVMSRPLAGCAGPLRLPPKSHAARTLATSPLEATTKLYQSVVSNSVKVFEESKKVVSDDLDAEIAGNKIVLFMEGSPDAPKSEVSLNAVKMLTQAQ